MRFFVFLITASVILSGCSAVPRAPIKDDQAAKQFTPSTDHAVIYVFRDQVLFGAAVGTAFFVDGKLIGAINDHDFRRLEVEPGKHQLVASSGTGVVANLPVEAEKGQLYFIRVTGWPRLMPVNGDEGKRQVLKCSLEQPN